jgi:hypothetical protein
MTTTTTPSNEALAARKELLAFELYHHGLVPGYTSDFDHSDDNTEECAASWRADSLLRVKARDLAELLEEAMLARGAPLLGTGLNAQLVQKSVTWLITEPAKQVYTLT